MDANESGKRPLEEGIDYNLEDGLFVLTKGYLLRRGTCCGSGCRNCPYPKSPRIVSLVPSWTETLILAGANVVGRTRYCVHPQDEKTKAIPVVGGTKDLNLEKLKEIKPDLIILDREENPRAFTENLPCAWIATHVTSVSDMPSQLNLLMSQFDANDPVAIQLSELRSRWERVLQSQGPGQAPNDAPRAMPGVLKWLHGDPEEVTASTTPASKEPDIVYVIWRDPWMAVTVGTFIASMLEQIGFVPERLWPKNEQAQKPGSERNSGVPTSGQYPTFDPQNIPNGSFIFLSSEPYPFHKKQFDVANTFPHASAVAILDGEMFSWFGRRSLEFLERVRTIR